MVEVLSIEAASDSFSYTRHSRTATPRSVRAKLSLLRPATRFSTAERDAHSNTNLQAC